MLSEQLKRFREPQLARQMLDKVKKSLQELQAHLGYKATFMEFCGTHTAAFSRTGLREELKEDVNLLSGPGCPVCVTADSHIDQVIAYSQLPNVIITTYGDMVKVPGTEKTLQEQKACGSDVRIVYSSLEALEIAKKNSNRPVIFIGVGFETTTPTAAMTLRKAMEEGVNNFYLYSLHKATAPALQALFSTNLPNIDGILLPGHVAIITGRRQWDVITKDYNLQGTIAGFEALDLLIALEDLCSRIQNSSKQVGNAYGRAVQEEGNIIARQAMDHLFELRDGPWRGLGTISQSVYKLKKEYKAYDAEEVFPLPSIPQGKPSPCLCGEILKGLKKPFECPLFAHRCNPIRPQGPCMVSHEGTCAIYYKYERTV
ncbi:hydrogenase formation protein HypD [Heliorestis convoluta]|uniref:Hydrogenase expression/formation protein HypD n=1 Tax=Heliorestis convoluta TaxID=356322 RepID=A0A5Q2N576_9FIRM|nr:hydrogenase formation protein HypD [Heliorestis convoluta]QGG48462.1 hydrogenase expression/formation protein HypD [Heliorestis convoluta]